MSTEKEKKKVIVKTYRGNEEGAIALFKNDSKLMAEKGYFPKNQVWVPGRYSGFSFFIAIILCIVLVGILIFLYMLIVKPDGALTVTYELAEAEQKTNSEHNGILVSDEIKKLSELHNSGILTDDEFTAQKQKLLNLL